jgi:Protein of unknown function (DUF4232)
VVWATVLAAVTAVLFVAGGALASSTGATAAEPHTAGRPGVLTTPFPSAPARRLARCQASQLTVQFGPSGAAGPDTTQLMTFENTSHRACVLDGYPNLHLDGRNGKRMTTRQRDGYLYKVPEREVSIASGRTASFGVAYPNGTGYDRLRCPTSRVVQVHPPGDQRSIGVGWRITPYGGTVRHLRCGVLMVSPVYAGAGQPPHARTAASATTAPQQIGSEV